MIATFGVLLKMSVYCNDLYSDVQVIQELESRNLTKFLLKEGEIKHFFLKEFKEIGIPALTEPCELLDLFEEIPDDKIPFYSTLISNISNIHWNPNRNSELHFSDVLDVLKGLVDTYEDIKKIFARNKFAGNQMKQMGISKMIKLLEQVEKALNNADSGFTGIYISNLRP